MKKLFTNLSVLLLVLICNSLSAQEIKDIVPEPIYDGDRSLIELYYKAWEIADRRIMHTPGMPTERYMDEGCVDGFGPQKGQTRGDIAGVLVTRTSGRD